MWTEDYELTEAVVSRLREDAPKLEHRLGLLYADAMEAYLRFVRDEDATAIPALLGIAERGEAVPYVFQAARLRRDVARLMAVVGDREGASRELRRAHEVFQRLGAQLELRLTREQIRGLGLRPPYNTNGVRGLLTAREREVALLALPRRPPQTPPLVAESNSSACWGGRTSRS